MGEQVRHLAVIQDVIRKRLATNHAPLSDDHAPVSIGPMVAEVGPPRSGQVVTVGVEPPDGNPVAHERNLLSKSERLPWGDRESSDVVKQCQYGDIEI